MTEEQVHELDRGDVASDLTERRQGAEPPLWPRTHDCLAAAFGKVAVWLMDLASGRFETDGSLERIIGYEPGEIGTEPAEWRRVTHPDDLERTTLAWQRVSAGVTDRYDCECRLLHKDGSVRWVDVCGAGRKDETGRVVRVAGTTVDITERKRAEQRRSADLEAMARLQQIGSLTICEGNLEAALDRIVDVAVAITGADFGHAQVLDPATGDLRIVAQHGFPDWWLDYWNAVNKGQGVCGTALACCERVIVEDVEQSPLFVGTPALEVQLRAGVRAVQSTALVGRDGEQLGLLSTHYRTPRRPDERMLYFLDLLARQATDILRSAQSEQAMRANEERFRVALAAAPIVVFNQDRDLRYTWIGNPALGISDEAALGRTDHELLDADFAGPLTAIKRRVLQTGQGERQEVLVARDNQSGWFDLTVEPLRDAAEKTVGITCAAVDITERKRVQEEMDQLRSQLWHLERVGRSGVIAASLAHELNQPLMGILSTAQAGLRFLAAGNLDSQRIEEILANIARDAQRAGAVINGVRTLLGRAESQRQPTGLAEVTREVLDLLSGEFASRRIECRLRSDVDAVVRANKAQIQQVLLNLITNALDAVGDEPPERRRVELTLGRADPGQAKVTVRDFGPGIAPEQRATLFRPFATTKVHGLGIGLAISFTIVEAHGGRLWYEEPPDRGAILCFTLPLDASDEAVSDS